VIDDRLLGAIYRGEAQLLRDSLASSSSVVDVDEDGRTVLMCAVLADIPATVKSEILEILLERGAPVNHKDTDQAWTALAFAARDCSAAVCSLLIAAGAEIDATDTFGNTAWTAPGRRPFSVIQRWRCTDVGKERVHMLDHIILTVSDVERSTGTDLRCGGGTSKVAAPTTGKRGYDC
jgi:hypothetical protein